MRQSDRPEECAGAQPPGRARAMRHYHVHRMEAEVHRIDCDCCAPARSPSAAVSRSERLGKGVYDELTMHLCFASLLGAAHKASQGDEE